MNHMNLNTLHKKDVHVSAFKDDNKFLLKYNIIASLKEKVEYWEEVHEH